MGVGVVGDLSGGKSGFDLIYKVKKEILNFAFYTFFMWHCDRTFHFVASIPNIIYYVYTRAKSIEKAFGIQKIKNYGDIRS